MVEVFGSLARLDALFRRKKKNTGKDKIDFLKLKSGPPHPSCSQVLLPLLPTVQCAETEFH